MEINQEEIFRKLVLVLEGICQGQVCFSLSLKCVSLGGALSRMSLLFAFTIGQKKSSLSRPVTQSYAKVHNILLLEYLLLDVRSILSKLVQTSRLID